MFAMFKSTEDKLLANLRILETQVESFRSELPADWLVHEDIRKHLALISERATQTVALLDRSESSRLLSRLNARYADVLVSLERTTFFINRTLNARSTDMSEVHFDSARDTLEKLSQQLHSLNLIAANYPVFKLHNRKLLKEVLAGLASKKYLPPDVGFDGAQKIARSFSDSELILAVQYNTSDKPYLFVTLEDGRPVPIIVKKGDLGVNYVVSRLMSLLQMNHMRIDYERKLIDGEILHLNKLEYKKGIPIVSMGRLRGHEPTVVFAYLLGAACADGFALNLSDRPQNVYISLDDFTAATKKPNAFLGARNPVFHLDYEFNPSKDAQAYIAGQLCGTYGVWVHLLADIADPAVSHDEVTEVFNRGYLQELLRIEYMYGQNKQSMDKILSKNGLDYLRERFSGSSIALLESTEKEFIQGLSRLRPAA